MNKADKLYQNLLESGYVEKRLNSDRNYNNLLRRAMTMFEKLKHNLPSEVVPILVRYSDTISNLNLIEQKEYFRCKLKGRL